MLQVYKASAGSGKTYNLAKEYIKILLAAKRPDGTYRLRPLVYRPHEHVLAITFTNKATNEMTERIIRELAILARVKSVADRKSSYHKDFVAEFNCTDQQLVDAAGYALFTLLSDYNYFNVSTIDSFFQNVLRIFTRELELSDDFNLEIDDRYTITLGINEMFKSLSYRTDDSEAAGQRKWTRYWITQYMMTCLEEGKVFNMFSRSANLQENIVSAISNFMDEKFKINSTAIRRYFSDPDRLPRFVQSLNKARETIEQRLSAAAAAVLPCFDLSIGQKTWYNMLEGYASGKWGAKGLTYITDAKLALFDDETKLFKKDKYNEEMVTRVKEYLDLHMRAASQYATIAYMRSQLYNMGIFGCVLSFIEQFCRDNNQILLSETNNLLYNFIKDDDTPFVYERLGYYLHHFLLDEFQDTSKMQWANLRPLLMESLSHVENYDNLIIGDEKQCIYRFRNADPELLGHEVADEVVQRYDSDTVRARGHAGKDNTNWRSSRDVIMFNNSLFTALAHIIDARSNPRAAMLSDGPVTAESYMQSIFTHSRRPTLSVRQVYANVVQQVAADNCGYRGYVKLIFEPDIDTQSTSPVSADELPRIPDCEEAELKEKERYNLFAADTIVTEIDRQLSAGYHPRDIAILVRSHSEGEFVIDTLTEAMNADGWRHGHIDILSADAVSISSSSTVRLIISVLRQFVDPIADCDGGDEGLTERDKRRMTLRQRIIDLHNRFEYYCTAGDISASEALDMALRHERGDYRDTDPQYLTNEQIRQRAAEAGDMKCPSLVSLVERIIPRYISDDALRRDTAYIMALQDLVIEYESIHGSDLRSFISWWDRTGYRSPLNSPSGIDAISVMTIHQSKGLEFKCVLLPFLNGELYQDHTSFRHSVDWYDVDKSLFSGLIDEDCIPDMIPLENLKRLKLTEAFGSQYADIVCRRRIDELNVIYVAMTRAVEELIICTSSLNTSDNGEAIAGYLRDAIQLLSPANILPSGNTLATEDTAPWMLPLGQALVDNVLEVGTPHLPQQPAADTGVPAEVTDSPTPSASHREPEKLPMPVYFAIDNDEMITTTDDIVGPVDLHDPRQRGRLLHSILQHVTTADTLELALRRRAYRTHLSDSETDSCRNLLADAINSVADRGWFDGYTRVMSERTISRFGENKRPDRIIWTSDGHIDIVDFKFTEPPVSDADARKRHDKYCRQVRNYVSTLVAAGYRNVRGYIWYIDESNIVPVS